MSESQASLHDDAPADTQPVTSSLRLLIGLAAIALILLFMRSAASIIDPLLLALVITMAVSPLTNLLVRRGLPAWLAWFVTVVITIGAIAFVALVVVVGVSHLVADLPQYQADLAGRWKQATDAISHTGVDASGATQGGDAPLAPEAVISFAVKTLRAVERAVSLGSLTLLLVFFMLGEAVTISRRFASTPPRVSNALARLDDFTRDMRHFVQAKTVAGLLAGTAVTVLLRLLDVPYPALWGLFAFLMAFIPTLGPLIAMLPPTFLAMIELGWGQALAVLIGILLIYAVVGSAVARPMLTRRTNLSPLAVVVSVVVWGWVLGLLGGLLAVPMTLLVRRLLIETYDESGWMTALLGRAPAALPHATKR